MEPNENPVKVLYVMGAVRSGSTLLDMVLGSHPEIQGSGELVNAVRTVWLKKEHCSCGERVGNCSFWSEVWRVWAERSSADFERYVALQDAFERYRRLPNLLRERRKPSCEFQEYAESTRAFFETIRRVGGRPVVVDSSKDPVRALALSMVPGIDLRLVHLRPDGRGVAASLNRSWRKGEEAGVTHDIKWQPVWRTAVLWIGVNLLSEWVRRQLGPGKSVSIRYEDLMATPRDTLDRIGRLLKTNLLPAAEQLVRGGTVKALHNVAGNRLRMSKDVQLKPDAGVWRNTLSWALMGWLLRRYGYRK